MTIARKGVVMPSPFPGMDPYLEDPALWPEFHRRFVAVLDQIVTPGLLDRYVTTVGQRHDPKSHGEGFLEIRQAGDGQLVSLLTVVSPANRTTAEGRRAYLEQWQQARDSGANRVEIDLVLQGRPLLDYSRDGLPAWDYAVTVARATQPERYEIYTSCLEKRLPRFRLPMGGGDRDTVLDLQVAFTRCYDEGGYAGRIDYCQDPAGPLDQDTYRFLDATLTARNLRGPTPPHEDIAVLAHAIWEQEGRPHGRDKQHWQQALTQLRRTK